jgi:hypothetical protein
MSMGGFCISWCVVCCRGDSPRSLRLYRPKRGGFPRHARTRWPFALFARSNRSGDAEEADSQRRCLVAAGLREAAGRAGAAAASPASLHRGLLRCGLQARRRGRWRRALQRGGAGERRCSRCGARIYGVGSFASMRSSSRRTSSRRSRSSVQRCDDCAHPHVLEKTTDRVCNFSLAPVEIPPSTVYLAQCTVALAQLLCELAQSLCELAQLLCELARSPVLLAQSLCKLTRCLLPVAL